VRAATLACRHSPDSQELTRPNQIHSLKKIGRGFQGLKPVKDTITANMPTAEFLAKYAPNTPITRPMGTHEGPLSNRKIREVLGFKEAHPWRNYVKV